MAATDQAEEEMPLRVTVIEDEEVARILQPHCSSQPGHSMSDSRVPRIDLETSSISRDDKSQTSEATICDICHNGRFQEVKASAHDKRMLKPCFCDFHCHHGCLRDILLKRKKCLLCGVQYRVLKYGSAMDFFKRYWYQYACCGLTAGFLLFLGSSGMYEAIAIRGQFDVYRYLLVIFCSVLLILAFTCIVCCCRNTFCYRLRRFRERYGEITIFDYKPDRNAKGSARATKGELATLNRIESGVPSNVTVGQYLLGNKETGSWQQSSTPLDGDNQPVRFTFETPMNGLETQKNQAENPPIVAQEQPQERKSSA